MKVLILHFITFLSLLSSSTFSQVVKNVIPENEWITITGCDSFRMGSPKYETGRDNMDETQCTVRLLPYKICKYEITFEQYDSFCKAVRKTPPDDGGMGRGKRPVINVSWNDAIIFADSMHCRLPSEAEWEYACRAGTKTPFNTGNNLTTMDANFNSNFKDQTTEVGHFRPNAWGIYDMHGNVWEWCSDRYKINYADNKYPYRVFFVIRGGGYQSSYGYCRSAARFKYDPDGTYEDVGFRLVKKE